MTYLLSFFACLMTFVSIMGKTWNNGKPTLTGWCLLGLAVVVLLIAVRKHYIDDMKANKMLEDAKKISTIARMQVLRGAHAVTSTYAVIYFGAINNSYRNNSISKDNAEKLTKMLIDFVHVSHEDLIAIQFNRIINLLPAILKHEEYLQKTSLRDDSPLEHPTGDGTSDAEDVRPTWKNIFELYATKGIYELDKTVDVYGHVLSSGEFEAIQKLRNTWLMQRMDNLNKLPDAMALSDFLRLDEQTDENKKQKIFEEFLSKVKNVVEICSSYLEDHPAGGRTGG